MIRVAAVFGFLILVGLVGCKNDRQGADQSQAAKEDWAQEHIEVLDHPEAELLVRHGSINNLGFGWPQGFNPFSGASTPAHPYPWQANSKAAQGTDRILVVSSYMGTPPAGKDGYTNTTARPHNCPVPIPITFTPPKFLLHSAVLQVFVDDFQAPVWKSNFQATMNDWRVPEFEAILNSLNQTGPIGKLVTFQLPAEVVKTLETGNLTILVDDPTTGAGDGYAFDFFRLLINPRGSKYRGTLTGRVTDEAEDKPIAGAIVSAGGVVKTQTAADGTYKLDDVPAGLATVMFSREGYQHKTTTTDLLASKTQQVDARLKAVKLELFRKEEAALRPRRIDSSNEPIAKTTREKERDAELLATSEERNKPNASPLSPLPAVNPSQGEKKVQPDTSPLPLKDAMPADIPANLSGTWDGQLTQSGSPLPAKYVFVLNQKGNTVAGTASIQNPQVAKFNAVMEIQGTVQGNTFEFQETKMQKGMGSWLLKRGALNVSAINNALILSGSWVSPQQAGVGGQINVQKK